MDNSIETLSSHAKEGAEKINLPEVTETEMASFLIIRFQDSVDPWYFSSKIL